MSKKPKKNKRPKRRELPTFDAVLEMHGQGKLQEALTGYRALLKHDPRNARLHHLLGRLLHQMGEHRQAVQSLSMSLDLVADDSQCLNDLGLVYQNTDQSQKAVKCFQRVLKLEPANANAANNLGVAYKSLDQLEEARSAFESAVELAPSDLNAICNLGNLLKRLEEFAEAESVYREGLQLDPSNLEIYPNLIAVLRRQEKLKEADEVFDLWLQHDPENPVALHLKAAGASESPTRASQGYVREVFDEFADTFDSHLKKLDYQGPRLVQKAVDSLGWSSGQQLEVLDGGCGTGLCAGVLRPIAKKLSGVDLSSRMLEKAKELGLYDELVESDLVEYLLAHPDAFDLILVADTFGYFGDLVVPLTAVSQSLLDAGNLVCTIELDESESLPTETGFRLLSSGRYRHSQQYIESAFRESGLTITSMNAETFRMEADVPQAAMVVTATR